MYYNSIILTFKIIFYNYMRIQLYNIVALFSVREAD